MDDRKLKILAAVVDEYVQTGEPVGSKTIAALPHINVSAATVRNDMAVLEQLGLLEQPHTSAGRIPTFNGYRRYSDKDQILEPLFGQILNGYALQVLLHIMCEKFKLLIAQIKLQPTGFVFDAAVGCNQQDHIQPLAGGDYLHLGDDGKLRCCIGHYRCALGQLRKGCGI